MVKITIGKYIFDAQLADTKAAEKFKMLLPLIIHMDELNGSEKYHYLDVFLPVGPPVSGSIVVGDLMLYGRECLVLFYKTFHTVHNYTRIGKIFNPDMLGKAVGNGSVIVKFE